MASDLDLVFSLILLSFGIWFVAISISKSDWIKTPKEKRPKIAEHLQSKDPPGITAIIFVCIIVIGLPIISGTMLVEWNSEKQNDYIPYNTLITIKFCE